ncbi:MAG: primosomal protein N' [Gemmatimonadota bacterium]|nr:primosomal protein N' [Gemmatimonadota bacterium]
MALARPLLRSFQYRVPPGLADRARPGVRVRVPFGRRRETGILEELETAPDAGGARIRDVLDVLDPEPVLHPALLDLCRWVARYYVAPPGLVYRAALPPGMLGGRRAGGGPLHRQVIRLVHDLPTLREREEAFGRARRQREAFETLETLGGRAEVAHLERRLGFTRSVLAGLAEKGLATIADEPVERDPFAGPGLPVVTPGPIEPNPDQVGVLERLTARMDGPRPGTVVLRGITGSGKTEVYLRLMRRALDAGRSAMLLVPEIALTPQTVQRVRAAFGDRVAVLHSGLSDGERHDAWEALRAGRRRVAVGTRSAVFAPLRDLGVIVVDEEHDGSYKQSETPRYHARAVAVVRARAEGALCVLGSATPSLESWALARAGKWELETLPRRATPHALPGVELVDLRAEEGPAPRIFSERLHAALAARLERGEQAILLLNRRGHSTWVACPDCGRVETCRSCNVSLTWHRRRGRLVCHHCGFEVEHRETCRNCGSEALRFQGFGTEQVERRLGELFPAARIARMDVDTTSGKWSHGRILETVRRGEVDVLLGTQMIAKGLDLPGITLVGVIDADVGLNLPDFRSAERTFQLLAQVAGRAGRGPVPGEVLVQTSRPDHFALRAARGHDYVAFADREMEDRAGPGYPPHLRLANLVVSGGPEEAVADAAEALADRIERWIADDAPEGGTGAAAGADAAAGAGGTSGATAAAGLELVGPAPCPIDRLRGRWRWHALLKSPDPARLGRLLRALAADPPVPSGLRLEIDRDPEQLL